MSPSPVFRRALPENAALLTEIAHAARQSWGYPTEWMAEWRSALTVTPEHIRTGPASTRRQC